MSKSKNDKKPTAKVIGEDGNVFNTLAICSKALKRDGQHDKAKEMSDRVFDAENYQQALNIMQEYCTFA